MFLTRPQYDKLTLIMTADQSLYNEYITCVREWGLGGVTIHQPTARLLSVMGYLKGM